MAPDRDKSGRPVVVVTGMGIVTSLGAGKTDNWDKLTSGKSGIRAIRRFSTEGLKTRIAPALVPDGAAVISGASGAAPATAAERQFLATHPDLPVRATATLIGHGIEAQMVMNVALAAMAVNRGTLFPPCGSASFEQPMERPLKQVVVTGVGHWRGEGLALVEAVD